MKIAKTTLSYQGHPLNEQIEYIKQNSANFYTSDTIDLATARTISATPYNVVGDTLSVAAINGNAEIVFNDQENPRISLNNTRAFTTPFYRFWIINSAQVGKALTLVIGKDAAFDCESVKSIKIANSAGADIDPLTDNRLTPVEMANETAAAALADTDILSADITPANAPCVVRTSIALDTAGVFSAMVTTGAVQRKLKLNNAANLNADCLYTFDIPLHSGDTLNFQTSVAGNVLILRAIELDGGIS